MKFLSYIYFENLNANFMTSIKNFFLNIDHFYFFLSAEQREMIDNLKILGIDSLLSFGEIDSVFTAVFGDFFNSFFSDFPVVRQNEYKDLSELVVIFSMRNNYVDYSPVFDDFFTQAYYFPLVVNPLGHEGINLDKFDTYMLGDNDLSAFQHRSLDTDIHVIACSLMSTRFLINALDVLHSFTILSSGLKIDAIVGRVNDMTMFFLREGLFYGQCSELCGAGHYSMPVVLEIMPYYFFFGYHEHSF